MPKEVNLTGDQVVALTRKYLSSEDVVLVQKALFYAVDRHRGQFRQSGEPYIIHPIQVAGILAKLKLDAVSVACGFLHDVVEDTAATLDDLEGEFGHDVRVIVDGVTKLGKVKYMSHEDVQGYPCHFGQAGGSFAQYANAQASAQRQAGTYLT